jgi:hypothetical protein
MYGFVLAFPAADELPPPDVPAMAIAYYKIRFSDITLPLTSIILRY